MSRNPYEVLLKPVLTEKATDGQVRPRPQYTFKVAIDSNKVEIRQAGFHGSLFDGDRGWNAPG